MSNITRATLVINETYADEYVRAHMTPLKVAQALADAGLLMPDLPEPVENEDNGNPSWFNGWVEQDWGEVELHHNGYANGEEETTFTAEESRNLAYALLAAANYAERNQ